MCHVPQRRTVKCAPVSHVYPSAELCWVAVCCLSLLLGVSVGVGICGFDPAVLVLAGDNAKDVHLHFTLVSVHLKNGTRLSPFRYLH